MDGQGGQSQIPRPPDVPAQIPVSPLEQSLVSAETPLKSIPQELTDILTTIRAINDIRDEIIRLGLNPSLRLALDTEVIPLVNILLALSSATSFYSDAALNLHSINFSKSSEIKKLLDLVYDLSDISEDVIEVVNKLLQITLPKASSHK